MQEEDPEVAVGGGERTGSWGRDPWAVGLLLVELFLGSQFWVLGGPDFDPRVGAARLPTGRRRRRPVASGR